MSLKDQLAGILKKPVIQMPVIPATQPAPITNTKTQYYNANYQKWQGIGQPKHVTDAQNAGKGFTVEKQITESNKQIVPILKEANVQALLRDRTIPLSVRIALRRKLEEDAIKPLTTTNTLKIAPEALAPAATPVHAKFVDVKTRQDIVIKPALPIIKNESFALNVPLNAKQLLAGQYSSEGKSFVLTGPAGSGKTTALREVARSLLRNATLGIHHFGHFKEDGPSIAFCAYTNRATDNMRRAIEKDEELAGQLQYNVLTIHKLLEFTMEWVIHPETGKQVPRFFPKRDDGNPLDITHLVLEEASQVDIPLFNLIFKAMRAGIVVILVGDINQLPPVFGPSILNYGLVQLPVIELNKVHRQALDSPVLAAAHNVLQGKMPVTDDKYFKIFKSKPGSKSPSEGKCCAVFIATWKKWIDNGDFNTETDICLSPFNKDKFPLGTKILNYHMAQYLGDKRGVKVYEVLAGRNTWYLAEGDRVMVEKQDGTIIKIVHNGRYSGKAPKSNFTDITRFGTPAHNGNNSGPSIDDDDFELEGYENLNIDDIAEEDKATQASYIVDIKLDDGKVITLDTAGDFSDAKFSLGYALSVHKAQGSEWRKVVFVMHRNFATLLFRELIYTAITRAREICYIIDLTNYLEKAITTQRVKGDTIKEKIEWFNSKLTMTEPVQIVPNKET